MPYDIHVSDNRGAASRQRARISLSDQKHKEIFSFSAEVMKTYPMIFSMGDFSRDCTYTHTSIVNLITEIQAMKNEAKISQQMKEFISALECLAEEAKSRNQSIYCFSD